MELGEGEGEGEGKKGRRVTSVYLVGNFEIFFFMELEERLG